MAVFFFGLGKQSKKANVRHAERSEASMPFAFKVSGRTDCSAFFPLPLGED
jgi:hypothetical protein